MFNFFKKQSNEAVKNAIRAVADGKLVALESVSDPVFSEKMLGDGIAIIPQNGNIVAPCDGEIILIYPTLHAFGIKNEEGVDILVHIGIDTVDLHGVGFTQFVDVNDKVKTGDKIISFDMNYLLNEQYDFTTMMIFPNCAKRLNKNDLGYVRKGKDVVITYD